MTLTLYPEGPEVPAASTTDSEAVPSSDPYQLVADVLGGGLTAAAVKDIADQLAMSKLELLRREAAANAESDDYDDDDETLADRAEDTRAAYDLQIAVIEDTPSDDDR